MRMIFNQFRRGEDGAVTVEWVVLTAAVVGLAIAGYTGMSGASNSLAGNTDTTLANMTVGDVTIEE